MADKNDGLPAVEAGSLAELASMIPGGHLLPAEATASVAAGAAATDAGEGGEEGAGDETDLEAAGGEGAAAAGAETGAGEGEEESQTEEGNDDPNLPESVQKRINKLTALRKTAEEALGAEKAAREAAEAEARELKGQLAERGPVKPVPVPNDPLGDVTTVEGLQARVDEATRVEDWALANLDGATIRATDGSEQYLEGEQVRKHLVAARQVLREARKKEAYLEATAADTELANAINPEMWKPGTEAHKAAQEVLAVFPEIKRLPDFRSFMADWYAGYLARTKVASAAGAAAKKTEVPKPVLVPLAPKGPKGSVVPQVPAKAVKAESAMANVMNTGGSADAIADYLNQTS